MYFFKTTKSTHHFRWGLWKRLSLTTVLHCSFSTELPLPGQVRWELGLFLWLDMSADDPSPLITSPQSFSSWTCGLGLEGSLFLSAEAPRLLSKVNSVGEDLCGESTYVCLPSSIDPRIWAYDQLGSFCSTDKIGVVSDQKCILGVSVVVLWSADCFPFCPVGEGKKILMAVSKKVSQWTSHGFMAF